MRWEEIDAKAWTIAAERYKTGVPNTVPLTDEIKAQLGKRAEARLRLLDDATERSPSRGSARPSARSTMRSPTSARRNAAIAMPQWQLHDLRRTARSLLSRAGVAPDIGERVLGSCHPRRPRRLRPALIPRREAGRSRAARRARGAHPQSARRQRRRAWTLKGLIPPSTQ